MKFSTEIRTGDLVTWNAPQFTGGAFYGSRSRGAKYVCDLEMTGKVIRHSYGEKTQQHTFTVQLSDGTKKLVKGRNLYRNLIRHVPDQNSEDRT